MIDLRKTSKRVYVKGRSQTSVIVYCAFSFSASALVCLMYYYEVSHIIKRLLLNIFYDFSPDVKKKK